MDLPECGKLNRNTDLELNELQLYSRYNRVLRAVEFTGLAVGFTRDLVVRLCAAYGRIDAFRSRSDEGRAIVEFANGEAGAIACRRLDLQVLSGQRLRAKRLFSGRQERERRRSEVCVSGVARGVARGVDSRHGADEELGRARLLLERYGEVLDCRWTDVGSSSCEGETIGEVGGTIAATFALSENAFAAIRQLTGRIVGGTQLRVCLSDGQMLLDSVRHAMEIAGKWEDQKRTPRSPISYVIGVEKESLRKPPPIVDKSRNRFMRALRPLNPIRIVAEATRLAILGAKRSGRLIPMRGTLVYIRHLPADYDDMYITRLLSDYGQVNSVQVVHSSPRREDGHAFVSMRLLDSRAQKFLEQQLALHTFNGVAVRLLVCDIANCE